MDGMPQKTNAQPCTQPNIIRRACVLIPSLLVALSATAQASYTCPNANTESEMYDCLQLQLKTSDQALNQAYKTLITRYKENGAFENHPSQDVMLKKAQLAWIVLRDASCEFETYDSMGGSGFGTIHTACLLEQTQKRVEYLQGFVGEP